MDRIRQIFDSHPKPASDAGDEAFALVQAASECAHACTTCADACLEADDPGPLRKCIRLNQDCAGICFLVGQLISRPGPQDSHLLQAQLDACAAACKACAEECEAHGDRMAHCRICAEACHACARACEVMKARLVA